MIYTYIYNIQIYDTDTIILFTQLFKIGKNEGNIHVIEEEEEEEEEEDDDDDKKEGKKE
jgi:hypothetical protein